MKNLFKRKRKLSINKDNLAELASAINSIALNKFTQKEYKAFELFLEAIHFQLNGANTALQRLLSENQALKEANENLAQKWIKDADISSE